MENQIKLLGVSNDEFQSKISRFKDKSFRLSASRLKKLTTPFSFTKQLFEPREPNAGMALGSLVDALITLSEDDFNKKYVITEETVSKGNQQTIFDHVVSKYEEYKKNEMLEEFSLEETIAQAYYLNYKTGTPSKVAHLNPIIEAHISGKNVITPDEYEKALFVKDRLISAPEVIEILEETNSFQTKLEFSYRGWDFLSFLDVQYRDDFADFKFSSRLSPDYLHKPILDYGYDLQFGLYSLGLQVHKINRYALGKFIFFDDKGEYIVRSMTEEFMNYSRRKVDIYLNRLERMVFEDAWFRSYDYFEGDSVIQKPRWIKGFSEKDLRGL